MKTLIATLLMAAAFSSQAQGIGAGVQEQQRSGLFVGAGYDYDLANSNPRGVQSNQRRALTIGQITKYGAFDITGYESARNGTRDDTTSGYELGYSAKYTFQNQFFVGGRFGLGHLENLTLANGKHHANYRQLNMDLGYNVSDKLAVLASARHRFTGDVPLQNKYGLGVQYLIRPDTQLRVGVAQTRSGGLIYNGVTSAVFYQF